MDDEYYNKAVKLISNCKDCLLAKEVFVTQEGRWEIRSEYDMIRYHVYCVLAQDIESRWRDRSRIKQGYEIFNEICLYMKYKILIKNESL